MTQQGKFTGVALRYPNSFSLSAESEIFDEVKQEQRVIRYVIGERSIYKDEQSKPTDSNPIKVQRVQFEKGYISVRREESILMTFLMLHPQNESNPWRDKTKEILFFENKPDFSAKAALDNDKIFIEARSWVHNTEWKFVKMHAEALGIDVDNKTSDEVKHDLIAGFAGKDPAAFLRKLNDQSTKRLYTIRQAIKQEVILINKEEGSVKWPGGNIICKAPIGLDAITHLVNQTFIDQTGNDLYEHICMLVNNEEPVEVKPIGSEHKIQYVADDTISLIKAAIEAKVIDDKISWLFYKLGTAQEKKWHGKKALIKELTNNVEFKERLKLELNPRKQNLEPTPV